MSLHSLIGAIDTDIEDWPSYVERLQHYFTVNEVASEEKRCATLLTASGPPTYRQLRSLATPRKLSDLSFEEIFTLAADYYHPTPSLAVQRFKFNSRNRHSGESVADYVAELRRLSEYCKYDVTLTDMLRDCLVCGINDHRMQRRLLAEKELTFAKALELAQAMEAARVGRAKFA